MRVLQVVTQLEPAGAQKLAAWIGSAFECNNLDVSTIFIYEKSSADFFPDPEIVSEGRPGGLIGAVGMAIRLRRIIAKHAPDIILAHTHYSILLCGWCPSVRGRRWLPCIIGLSIDILSCADYG